MNRKFHIALIMLIPLILAAGGFAVWLFSNRAPKNPPGTIGNTAGNLNNGGFFCEYNGTVYFANSYDGGSLYAMDSSENNLRKLSAVGVRNLLAGGDRLYYFQTGVSGASGFGAIRQVRSFNRCRLNGKNAVSLAQDTVLAAQLVDNGLYLMTTGDNGLSFYKTDLNGENQTVLADYEVNPACAANGRIYYNGTRDNHYLYQLDTATDISREVWQGNLWYPVISGDYIYYMDVGNNYRLCRYSLSQNKAEALTEDRVDCFNVGSGYIYYQKNGDTPQLKGMREDGSGVFVLAEGNYCNLNMTSGYLYFQEFGNEAALYHSPLGSAAYDVFAAARDAALSVD